MVNTRWVPISIIPLPFFHLCEIPTSPLLLRSFEVMPSWFAGHLMPSHCWRELAEAKDLAIYGPCHSGQVLSEFLSSIKTPNISQKPCPALFGVTEKWGEGLRAKESHDFG